MNFYQWWTPNTAIPDWYEGIYLPADGWIIDPYTLSIEMYPIARYHMSVDPYRRLLQKYLVTGKPLISIIASPEVSPLLTNVMHKTIANNRTDAPIR